MTTQLRATTGFSPAVGVRLSAAAELTGLNRARRRAERFPGKALRT